MYFPDRGCVRPLRHLYGYATAPTHRGANLRPALSPKIFHFFCFLIDKGGLMRRGFIGISGGLLRRGTKETRCCAPCCGGAVAAGRPSSAAVDRSLLPAGRSAANPPHTAAAVDRRDRQTDGRTADSGPLHRPCSAYHASSVKSREIIAETSKINSTSGCGYERAAACFRNTPKKNSLRVQWASPMTFLTTCSTYKTRQDKTRRESVKILQPAAGLDHQSIYMY